MKIWIHTNNVQEGPFSIEELPLQRMTPDTPVWYVGLDDWTAAKDAPLTAPYFTDYVPMANSEEPFEYRATIGEYTEAETEAEAEQPKPEETLPTEPAQPQASAPCPPPQQQGPQRPNPQQPWQQGPYPQQQPWQQGPYPQQQPWQQGPYPQQPYPQPWQPGPQGPQPMPQHPCNCQQCPMMSGPKGQSPASGNANDQQPKTYLAWSILMTLLCCNPVGIIPIVLGIMTMTRTNAGDIEGARRLSATNEWWIIITIVTCLVFIPLTLLSF